MGDTPKTALVMKRLFDITLSIAISPVALLFMVFIAIAVKTTSEGPVLHWSSRVGRQRRLFRMAKVRTMVVGAPQLATHLMTGSASYLTPVGGFLRKTSFDEIPQLWHILKGDMSFVGPRPALFNQDDLVALREKAGINELTPGLTGWAQIMGRDDLSIEDKVALETEYLKRESFWLDLYIIAKTFSNVLARKGVSH